MSDFDNWLEERRNMCHHPVNGEAHIRAAWDYQQDRIVQLESEREWTSVESGGMPEEEGWYLCAFSDGSVESFYIADDDIAEGGWSSMNVRITHWTANPAHPGGE